MESERSHEGSASFAGSAAPHGDAMVPTAMLQLQALTLEHLPDAIFVLNARGAILYANGAARSLAPGSCEDPVGKIVGEQWGRWVGEYSTDHVLDILRTHGCLAGELHFPDGSGGIRSPCSCRMVRIAPPVEAEPRLYVVCVVRMDGAPWMLQGRLQDRRLWEAQKLESLETLAGGVAHDFNNLLMVVLGNADLALMDLGEDSPLRGYLEAIESGARRAAELSLKMLAYSGRALSQRQAIPLNAIVSDMAQMLRSLIAPGADLQFYLAPSLPTILADPHQIQQIFTNLVINASEALPDGVGRIWIHTGWLWCDREYLESPYLFDDLPEGHYVYLEVEDTGSGMDAKTLQRIFDPFFSTRFTGRGLGLPAILGMVKAHGGAVKVDSRPGCGSVFRVLFPVVHASGGGGHG